MSSSGSSSRPSTAGSEKKDKPNPLIRQDFELTEELKKYVEAGYDSCEMDMQGNVCTEDVRDVLIKLWVEQDQLEKKGDQNQGDQEDQDQEDQDQGDQDKSDQDQKGQNQRDQNQRGQNQRDQNQRGQNQRDQNQRGQNQRDQNQGRANSRANSRAGSQKQNDDDTKNEEKDDDCLKAIEREVDIIMKDVEEAAYKTLYGVDGDDNRKNVRIVKEQFFDAACTVLWVRRAHIVVRQLFKVFDDDSDGYIEAKDLCRVMEEVEKPLKPDELRGMMDTADHDEDGKIPFDDFKKVMMKQY